MYMARKTAEKGTEAKMSDIRGKLSTLWIVVMFNMLYADVLSFLNPELLRGLMTGYAEGIRVTQQLLVGGWKRPRTPVLMLTQPDVVPISEAYR
jgi:hypothetical protein